MGGKALSTEPLLTPRWEGWSAERVSTIEEAFRQFANDLKVTEELKELYKSVWPEDRKAQIAAGRREMGALAKRALIDITSETTHGDILDRMREIAARLRRLGDISTTEAIYSADEDLRTATLVSEIERDFYRGDPRTFPFVARLIGRRWFGNHPVDLGKEKSIPRLVAMSTLGVAEATRQLCHIYSTNFLGEVELNMQKSVRKERLEALAAGGHPRACALLAKIGAHGGLSTSEEERKRYLEQLWLAGYRGKTMVEALVSASFWKPAPERYCALKVLAKECRYAFTALWDVHLKGVLGEIPIDFPETGWQERLMELEERNEEFFAEHAVELYIDRGSRWTVTEEERQAWLYEMAFVKKYRGVQECVSDFYHREDRNRLLQLASGGCERAQNLLDDTSTPPTRNQRYSWAIEGNRKYQEEILRAQDRTYRAFVEHILLDNGMAFKMRFLFGVLNHLRGHKGDPLPPVTPKSYRQATEWLSKKWPIGYDAAQ